MAWRSPVAGMTVVSATLAAGASVLLGPAAVAEAAPAPPGCNYRTPTLLFCDGPNGVTMMINRGHPQNQAPSVTAWGRAGSWVWLDRSHDPARGFEGPIARHRGEKSDAIPAGSTQFWRACTDAGGRPTCTSWAK